MTKWRYKISENTICQKDLVQDRIHINGMEGFWSFAKTDLAKYRDVCSDKFLLYLLDGVTTQQHRS